MSSRNKASNNGSDTHKPKEQRKGENHGEHENAGKQELDSTFYLVFGAIAMIASTTQTVISGP
jgi:hypothetical protein